MNVEKRFCTISAVQNGWLVDLGRPYRDGSCREDQMQVFTDAAVMGRWVTEYFGGGSSMPVPECKCVEPPPGIYDVPGVLEEAKP